MQRMYPLDLKSLLHANSDLTGLFLERIRQLSLVDYVLDFSRGRNLFISLNSATPFIVFDANLSDFPSRGDLHSFAIDLRRFLSGRLINISQPNDDMIIALEFESRNNILEKEITTLYIELIPNHPQAVLVSSQKRILAAFRYNHERGKDGRLIRRGKTFRLPLPLTLKDKDLSHNLPTIDKYLSLYEQRIIRQNYRDLFVYLEHNIKRLNRLILNYQKDLTKLENIPTLYEDANLLLMNKPEIAAESVQINGKIIKVDPRYNAIINADLLFKRAKKLKKSEEILNARINEAQERKNYLIALSLQVQTLKTHEAYLQVYEELGLNKPNVKTHIKSSLFPYFITYKDVRILFGRNNRQNDYLSFKIAKKTDVFMHIRNVPGAHIIIESKEPSHEVLEHAGKLALYLSRKSDGDITYTKVANIKKGPFPGQVLLNKEQTFFVRLKDEEALYFKNNIKRLI